MKRFLIVLGGLMILIISLIVAIPLLFQNELREMIITEANKSLEAKLELDDFNLSLIPNFPQLTAEISGIRLIGKGEFENRKLIDAQTISTTLDLKKLWNGDIEINEIYVNQVSVDVLILANGKANYDITKPSEEIEVEAADETSEESDFNLKLKAYSLENINITYDDREGDMFLEIKNLNHSGKGDFSLTQFILETKTTIEELNFAMEGMNYIKKAKANAIINLNMDMDAFRFQFDTSLIQMNELALKADGWVAMPGDSIDMDIQLATYNNSFKELFSLVPDAYTEDYKDVQVVGNMSAEASFKGVYYEEILPAFDISLIVKNGRVQYPDLPVAAENIGIDLNISSPGELEKMVVNLKKAHVELAENFFDMRMLISHSMTNPKMSGALKMDFDLATIPKMMPVEEGETYSGKIKSDIEFAADMNAIDQEQYDKVNASGDFEAWNITYDDGTAGFPYTINHVNMIFDLNNVKLQEFDAQLGKSDIQATGSLENFIPWYMSDDLLVGKLDMHSTYFNTDEWLTDTEEVSEENSSDTVQVDTTASDTYEIPQNIDFTMNSIINSLEYDSLIMEDLKGTIKIQNGQMNFINCGLKMFKGTADMNGMFDPSTNPQEPYFDFTFNILNWEIQPVAEAFNSIEKLAPILKSAEGNFSSKLHTTGVLDSNLEPNLMKLSFSGDFRTKNMSISNSNLEKLNAITKTTKFNPLVANDLKIVYRCSNGVLETEPFDIPLGKQKATVSGYTTLEEDINYIIDTKIKTSEMGAGAEELMKQLSNLVASTGVKPEMPEYIPLAIAVTGKVSDPQFKPSFGQFENNTKVTDAAKQMVKDKIEETKEDLKKDAKAEADKIMADARKQQEQILTEARKQADLLKSEAKKNGDKLRAEADKQANDLMAQAINPLTKVAAKKAGDELRKKADDAAKKLELEADAQGKKIIGEAQKQSDKIMEDAQKKADAKIEGF